MTVRHNVSFTLVEGDDIELEFSYYGATGLVFDMTNVTKAWVTIKKNQGDSDANALVGPLDSDTHSARMSYGAGKVTVRFTRDETGGLARFRQVYYDVQILNDGLIQTLGIGTLSFVHEITRATS